MAATEEDEEAYDSASDDDFNPETAPVPEEGADSSASSSEDDAAPTKAKTKPKRKRKALVEELDSGDEITIQASKRRKSDRDTEHLSDESGGEGGLIKTRAQRRVEKRERRPIARIDGATADVDAIWAKLRALPVGRPPDLVAEIEQLDGEETITIKRTFGFAGERHEEERIVPKDSAEARLYLAQQAEKAAKEKSITENEDKAVDTGADVDVSVDVNQEAEKDQNELRPSNKPALRRPLHRPSRFDPNPNAEVRAIPPSAQITWVRRRALLDPSTAEAINLAVETTNKENAPLAEQQAKGGMRTKSGKVENLNTVDMSRQDWVQYVDRAGLEEELDTHLKGKETYTGRMAFLNKVDQAIDEQSREAKAKASTS